MDHGELRFSQAFCIFCSLNFILIQLNICNTICLCPVAYEAGGRGRRRQPPGFINSGQTLFFRASASCWKFWIIKNIYSIQCIQGTVCFWGKRTLLKNPECKKYIQYSEKLRHTMFFSEAQVAQKSWMQEVYLIQWKISRQILISEQAQVAQKYWKIKNISMQWKFSGQAQVVQNSEW